MLRACTLYLVLCLLNLPYVEAKGRLSVERIATLWQQQSIHGILLPAETRLYYVGHNNPSHSGELVIPHYKWSLKQIIAKKEISIHGAVFGNSEPVSVELPRYSGTLAKSFTFKGITFPNGSKIKIECGDLCNQQNMTIIGQPIGTIEVLGTKIRKPREVSILNGALEQIIFSDSINFGDMILSDRIRFHNNGKLQAGKIDKSVKINGIECSNGPLYSSKLEIIGHKNRDKRVFSYNNQKRIYFHETEKQLRDIEDLNIALYDNGALALCGLKRKHLISGFAIDKLVALQRDGNLYAGYLHQAVSNDKFKIPRGAFIQIGTNGIIESISSPQSYTVNGQVYKGNSWFDENLLLVNNIPYE